MSYAVSDVTDNLVGHISHGTPFPAARSYHARKSATTLTTSHRVDVLDILRQRHFKPTFAAILSAKHLAIARRDVDLLGVAVMQTDRHQRAVRRHFVETLPSFTDVLAAVECTSFRRGRDAETSVERVRILRRNLDVAPVGER